MWLGFVVSHVGDFVQLIAQSWLVTELTRSALRVALVSLAQALPRLLIALAAGVVVDRADRRRLLLVTQCLAALQSVIFLALVVTHRITYGSLLVLALALGVLDSLNLTARQALMPTLVPRELLARSVALQSLGVNVTQIAGPLLSAALLGMLGVAGCVAVNALSFCVLLGALYTLELPRSSVAAPRGFLEELLEGAVFVRARATLVWPIALAWALGFLCMPLARLLSLFSREVLHTSAHGYGLLYTCSGVGALVASLTITARAERRELPRNIVLAGGTFACAVGAFAWARTPWLSALCLFAFGASQMAFRSAVVTLLQLEAPDRMRGRVMALLSMDFPLWSVGATLSGALADRVARVLTGEALPRALPLVLTAQATLALVVVALAAGPLLRARSTEESVP
jgi:MFS family permease